MSELVWYVDMRHQLCELLLTSLHAIISGTVMTERMRTTTSSLSLSSRFSFDMVVRTWNRCEWRSITSTGLTPLASAYHGHDIRDDKTKCNCECEINKQTNMTSSLRTILVAKR